VQVTYTFCYDFITLLVKDAQTAEFGRTEVLVEGLTRVSKLADLLCTQGEVTSQNLWSRNDSHVVGVTWHDVWS